MFLGVLLDGVHHCLVVPEEKRIRALNELEGLIDKKKATVKQLQQLTGLLNFLCRAIHLGRAFTRRMYAKFSWDAKPIEGQSGLMTQSVRSVQKLKQHHHV